MPAYLLSHFPEKYGRSGGETLFIIAIEEICRASAGPDVVYLASLGWRLFFALPFLSCVIIVFINHDMFGDRPAKGLVLIRFEDKAILLVIHVVVRCKSLVPGLLSQSN